MAATVVSIYRLEQTGVQFSLDGKERELLLYWVVKLSEPDTVNGGYIARYATGIPIEGDDIGSSGLVCLRSRAEVEGKSGLNYKVTLICGPNTLVSSGSILPWQQRSLIDWDTVPYEFAMEFDFNSDPMATPAGDPFDPPFLYTRRNGLAKVKYARLTSAFDPDTAQDLIDTVNQSAFTVRSLSCGIEKAALHNITANEEIYGSGTHYWNIIAEIEVERSVPVKNVELLPKGYNCYGTASTPSTKRFCTVDGTAGGDASVSPMYINANGTQWSGTGSPYKMTRKVRTTSSWSALHL